MLARQGSNRRGQRRGHRLGPSTALARLTLPARAPPRSAQGAREFFQNPIGDRELTDDLVALGDLGVEPSERFCLLSLGALAVERFLIRVEEFFAPALEGLLRDPSSARDLRCRLLLAQHAEHDLGPPLGR